MASVAVAAHLHHCDGHGDGDGGDGNTTHEQHISKNIDAPQHSLLEMMKSAKPAKVSKESLPFSEHFETPDVKAIKLDKRLLVRAIRNDECGFMLVRDFNIKAITSGTKVAVVLSNPMGMQDESEQQKNKHSNKVLPIIGVATFEANVTLTAETFADYKTLHLYDLSFEEYVEAASSSIKKRCREREHQRVIGWHFKRFTASKTGVVFVPSSPGSQDCCCFF